MAASNPSYVVPPPGSSPAPGAISLTNEIHGIRPPVPIPTGWEWVWWGFGALVAAAVAAYFIRRLRRSRVVPPTPPVPAHVRARQRLGAALALIHDPKVFCTAVSDAVRQYLEERFRYRAPERTTEEFLSELKSSGQLLPDQKKSLGEFLQGCDLVKFAQFEPTEDALRAWHDGALRLVDETQSDSMPSSASPPTIPPTIDVALTPASRVPSSLNRTA